MLVLALILVTLGSSKVFGQQSVPGHAVLAKPGGDALVIWDASSVVALIVKGKITDNAANAQLERDAISVLAKISRGLDKSAKTVTVRIIYSKSGAVSPAYGTPTFMGIERYATLAASAVDVRSNRAHWKALGASAPIPPWFSYRVLGLLPPH